MKILMLAIDSQILEEGTAVRKRMANYGSLGDELHIVVYNKVRAGGDRREKQQIAPTVWIYPTNTKYRPLYYLQGLRIAIPLLKKEGRWIITSQEAMTNVLALLLRMRFWRIPSHTQIHTDFLSPYFGRSFRMFLQRIGYWIGIMLASHIRVVSGRIKRSVVEQYGISPERVSVVPIFVDVERIKNTEAQEDVRRAYPQFVFFALTVSRLEPEKNVLLALEAFQGVAKKYSEAGLFVVGDGSLRGALEQKARDLGMEKNVVFIGATSDTISYYKSADAYVQTSDYEGFGLALAEAAAAGLPIVTTDVGLVGDILTKESALICEPRKAECIKRHLLSLYENKPMKKVLGDSAREAVSRGLVRDYSRYLTQQRDALARALQR